MKLIIFFILCGLFLNTNASELIDEEDEEQSAAWTQIVAEKLNELLDYNTLLNKRLENEELFFKVLTEVIKSEREISGSSNRGNGRTLDKNAELNNWTVIQRRRNISNILNGDWSKYKNGFGDPNGDFFIGLQKIHEMTTRIPHELHIELIDYKNNVYSSDYDEFVIGSESEKYELKSLGNFTGDLDIFINSEIGTKFSTFDRDSDGDRDANYASWSRSGWWHYSSCNLNGMRAYLGVYCFVPKNEYFFKNTVMMIRPKYG